MDQTLDAVAVTGALGNLGTKLLCHLAEVGVPRLVGLDMREDAGHVERIKRAATGVGRAEPDVSIVACDLSDPLDERWRGVLNSVSGCVHFAAQNPFPEATWGEASASLDMTVNTVAAAADSTTCNRYVFATSNHVMGRYRTAGLGAGKLTTDLAEGVGTVWDTGEAQLDSTPYATAKFAGERLCRGMGARSGGTDFVCVRIGWCQPGVNLRDTLSATGTPTQAQESTADSDLVATDRWFKGMWLSNRDMVHLFERALVADPVWPDGFVVVNGMSNNSGMVWSIESTRRLLGYAPQDDVFAAE